VIVKVVIQQPSKASNQPPGNVGCFTISCLTHQSGFCRAQHCGAHVNC